MWLPWDVMARSAGFAAPDAMNAASRVLMYYPPADPRGQWKTTDLLTGDLRATHNFDVGPLNTIILAGHAGVRPVMPGTDVAPMHFSERAAGEVRAGSKPLHFATIEPMHGNEVVVYDQTQEPIKRTVLNDKLVEGHALAYADVLGAGSDQVIAGWRGGRGGVHLWTPVDQARTRWRESVIDDGGMACEDLCLADLDGDGGLDIVASGRATHNLKIYWNQTGE